MDSAFDFMLRTIRPVVSLEEAEIQEIRTCLRQRRVRKKEIFLHAGQHCHTIFFVARGLVRTYHLHPSGTEFTRLILQEGQFCTILLSFNEHLPSSASIQALEDTVLLEVSAEDFRYLLRRIPQLQNLYLKLLEDYQTYHIQRMEPLTQCNSAERVRRFHNEYPQLTARLSKRTAASYLQLSPETYSRCCPA